MTAYYRRRRHHFLSSGKLFEAGMVISKLGGVPDFKGVCGSGNSSLSYFLISEVQMKIFVWASSTSSFITII